LSARLLRRVQRVPDLLRWRSNISPDAPALKLGDVQWSYRELQEHVSALSAVLRSRAIGKGDRVAVLMRTSERFVALSHALARLGAVAVPLNHAQSTPEVLSQLRDSDPSLVVHDEALAGKAKELEGRECGRRHVTRRWERASKLMAESASGGRAPVVGDQVDASSLHSIIYTSGSSGAPKGVELTLSNLMWNAISVGLRSGTSSRDSWLLCMPLFHVGGYTVIFRSVLHGSRVVLHPRFDPRRVSRSLDDDGITLVSFVPKMLSDVLEARGADPLNPSVRCIFLGGGQPPAPLLAAIRRRRLPVLLTYGMTETCSQVAISDALSSRGPVYHPLFPTDIAVTRPGKKGWVEIASAGEVGEIAVRGPTLFKGYWRKPSLTRARFSGEWFLTGDLGVLQPSRGRRGPATGALVVLGRKEETIVSGGEKVIPAEVEAALREHAAVKDAVVIGVEDASWGQRVVAVVETKTGSTDDRPSAQELSEFLRERVGGFKIPKQYHFWSKLPRTPTGKTLRVAVRSALEQGENQS